MEQLAWLVENGVEVHTQIVVTPGVNDGPHLEKSVRDLAALYPGVQSVSVVPVGLTQHHKYDMRVHTVKEAEELLERCHSWQEAYKRQLGVHFAYPTDEWYLVTRRPIPPRERYDGLSLEENGLGVVRRFLEEWEESLPEVEGRALFSDLETMPVRSLTLVTGTLFGETLKTHAGAFAEATGVSTDVVPVANARLGATITVAGLLMGRDIIEQLAGRDLGSVVVLPRVMFDHPEGISLDDVSPLDIAKALGKPVALADQMGDVVDVLHEQASLLFDPQQGLLVARDALQQTGGWAVEKYL
jgi:putative radical SAM enzyme (TIGR03279 family)